MNRLMVLIISVAIAASVIPAYSQEALPEQAAVNSKTVSGQIASVDLEKSALTLKTMDAVTGIEKDENIQVMPETAIVSGNVTIKLSDLKADEKVEVGYTVDQTGILQANTITVK